jgi:murein DD-endopeptidase MepM/ murein hydrolase activator NlpD
MRPGQAVLIIFLATACMPACAPAADRATAVAEQLRAAMNAGDHEGIQRMFTPAMQRALPMEKSREFFGDLTRQFGDLKSFDAPRRDGPGTILPARFERGMLDLKLSLDAGGRIAALFFQPHTPVKPAPQNHQTRLTLPLKDRWLVFWGGDTREVNYHHDTPNQRFALDLLGVDEHGRTRRGESNRNEDYFAFGREVVAPADGVIIEAIDGVRDNAPGSMNSYSAVGNAVVIRHRDDEFSVLAHFKQGSLRVKAGDPVKRGQVLGLCGNSGNSSEPHIHFHLQHSPWLQEGLGIKCRFDRVLLVREGKLETRADYSPVKGDLIAPE